jgi:tRNA(Ile)-lysidine synthase
VALSGGPDSVALLLAAHRWAAATGSQIEAAHLNHQLRGADASGDEEFCRDLCVRLGLELHVRQSDPRPLARQRGLGLEEAGRRLRFQFLEKLLDTRSVLTCAATGHHRDDQTETVIMRIFRGTGLDGLQGITPVVGRIIHPLLDVSRREIIAFLEAEGQPYRLDVTNETGDATRTRVRRELLPLVQDIFGGVEDAPARLADLATADFALLDRLARQELDRLLHGADLPPLCLAIDPLLKLDQALARRVLRLFLSEHGGLTEDLERVHVDAVLDWLPHGRSGSGLDLPRGWQVVREFDLLRFLPPSGDRSSLPRPGTYRILVQSERADDSVGVAVDPQPTPLATPASATAMAKDGSGWYLRCPAAALHGRLRVRPWREGDRIELFGLGGHKKVSDLLRERRIGVSERPYVQVVEDEEGILWIVGLAQAERTRLLPTTTQTVTIAVVLTDDSTKYDSGDADIDSRS